MYLFMSQKLAHQNCCVYQCILLVHKLTNLVLFPNRSLKFYANLYVGLLVLCLILWCMLTYDHRSDIRGNHFEFQHSSLLWSRRCRDFPPHGLMHCFWMLQNRLPFLPFFYLHSESLGPFSYKVLSC